ncbi:MAG: alanine racemase [Verrucomicrobia bacterium]|nr:alanine racemase [Verrucomicrobiota bacterium]
MHKKLNGNTWVELDLKVLASNLASVRRALRKGTEMIFLVKANAYGHGMIPVVRKAWRCGVRWFAVAHINDALELREALPKAGIIMVSVLDPAHAGLAARNRITPFVASRKHGLALAGEASARGQTIRCHAKIDTGMGRLGIAWQDAVEIVSELSAMRGLDIRGVCSHFATSDCPDKAFAWIQAERFSRVSAAIEQDLGRSLVKHISNSGGILAGAAWDHDAVRPGILIYGYGEPVSDKPPQNKRGISTAPFLQWKTRVLQVKTVPAGFPVSYGCTYTAPRKTSIATIDAGYSDGYFRLLSNKGHVLAGGRRCRIAGRVTMNLIAIDLGSRTTVREGDEVVLIGSQGKESIWADELAGQAGTIPYEILTNIKTVDRRIK